MLKNLFRRGATYWMPDADAASAPAGAFLRSDNIVQDEAGTPSLRRGSTTLYETQTGGQQDTGVHSLYSTQLPEPDPDGTTYDLAASGDTLWINGVDKGIEFNSTGDVAFGDDSYQVFCARGTSKYKWNGHDLYNWPIAAPSLAATLSGSSVSSTIFFNFASTGDTAVPSGATATITTPEGTSADAAGYAGTANTAKELTPAAASGRASICKIFTADQDCFNILSKAGGDTDLIDLYVWLEEPRKVNAITIMFGLGTGTDPFIDDYYSFEYNVRDAHTVDIKDAASLGAGAYAKAASKSQDAISPEDVTKTKTPTEAASILKRLGRYAGSRSMARADAAQASPAWTHFTVTRGQCSRVGSTSGRDWETVRGIKIVYEAVPGSTEKVRFDDLVIIGGGDRVLSGTYKVAYRFVNYTGEYYEMSPLSPVSDPIVLNQQALLITFPASSMSGADAQVNQVWAYLFGGFLDTWYRVAVLSSTATGGYWSLDEFTRASDGSPAPTSVALSGLVTAASTDATHVNLSAAAGVSAANDAYNTMIITITSGTGAGQLRTISDYVGATKVAEISAIWTDIPDATSAFIITEAATALTTKDRSDLDIGIGLEMGARTGITNPDVVLALRKGEMDALIDNEVLEPGAIGIPDNIIAIAGPWNNRMFLVTDEGYVYPTSQRSPSNCCVFHTIDLRRYGDPLWAVKTNGGIYVGLTKDVVRIGGTGDESDDHATADLYPEPLNVGNPPMDRAVYTDGNTVIYRSADSLQVLSGAAVTPVATGDTSLLWRGLGRHGVSALNIATGRFRLAIDNQILYMLASEGTDTNPTSIWRANLSGDVKAWSRTIYAGTPLSIFRNDLDGRLMIGTTDGDTIQLETGTQDDGVDIPAEILTPWLDGGEPLVRKVPFDIQLHCNTAGDTGTLYVAMDGGTATSYSFITSSSDIYRIDISDLATFFRTQWKITGSFGTFVLQAINLAYRSLVQQVMAVDTGYIIPPEPCDFVWLQEVEVDCISPSDLTAKVYIDDTLYTTQSVVVTANKRSVYPVPVPRGTKGRRLRILLQTTASAGAGNVGFECFRIRARQVGTGNAFEIPFQVSSPGGSE